MLVSHVIWIKFCFNLHSNQIMKTHWFSEMTKEAKKKLQKNSSIDF